MEYVYFKFNNLKKLVDFLNNNKIAKEDIVFLQYIESYFEAIFIKR